MRSAVYSPTARLPAAWASRHAIGSSRMLGVQIRQPNSGLFVYFEPADKTDAVVGMQTGRQRRVHGGQPRMQIVGDLQRRAERWVDRGRLDEAAQQPLQVQARASNHDDPRVGRDDRVGVGDEVGGIERERHVDLIDAEVRHPRPLLRGGLPSTDVESDIHLHRVGR